MSQIDTFEQELAAAGIAPDTVEDAYPLSPMQAGLVATTLQTLSSTDVADSRADTELPYFTRFLYRLAAPSKADQLERAWRALIDRHSILRTVYLETADHPDGIVQVVLEPQEAQKILKWKQVEGCSNMEREATDYLVETGKMAIQQRGAATATNFWHCAGLFVGESESPVFALGLHHSLYDGWSFNGLMQELESIYRDPSVLKTWKPSVPFSTFIDHCLDPDLQTSASVYWKQCLTDLNTVEWPKVKDSVAFAASKATKSASQEARTAFWDDSFDAPLFTAAASNAEVTPASLFKAALGYTISRHSGSTDVLLGYVESGRSVALEGIEEIVGPCISSVPLRLRFRRQDEGPHHQDKSSSAAMSGASVLEVVQEAETSSVKAIEHQQLGLDGITAAARSSQSLFSVLLAFQNFSDTDKDAQDSCFVPLHAHMQSSYPLVIQAELKGSQCHLHFEYQTAYITEKQMHYFSLHLQESIRRFLELVADGRAGDTLVSTLDLRAESEKRQDSSPDTQASTLRLGGQSNGLLLPWHRGVQQFALRNPCKVAIQSFDGVFWTYGHVWRLSVSLSRRIQEELQLPSRSQAAVGERLMPVALQKRPSTVVLLLALAILGFAYVPCDPGQPEARLNRILVQVGSKWLLTNGHRPSCRSETQIVDVEQWITQTTKDELDKIGIEEVDGVAAENELDRLCYQLFTSGSSGVPKGVQVSHHSVAASIQAQASLYERRDGQDTLDVGNDESRTQPTVQQMWTHRCLQFSQLSFDWSVWDLGSLVHGSTLCFRGMDEMLSDMQDTMNEMQITLLQTTPTVTKLFEAERNQHLTTLCLSGEPLTRSVVEAWTSPGVRIINAYGITEITVVCSAQDYVDATTPVSLIGRSLGLNQLRVVDEHGRPCPVDCPGELIVCGLQVAEGYAGDPERTRQSFFRLDDDATKAYRSGDIVVWDSEHDGLRYLHRKDKQINIKGLRIELGEVEAGLRRCYSEPLSTTPSSHRLSISSVAAEAINEEIVAFVAFSSSTGKQDRMEELQLYFDETHRKALQELARRARSQLSQYMIPSRWVAINHLPLGSSGKLDRRTLLDKYSSNHDAIQKSLASRDDVRSEQQLDSGLMETIRSAWATVLNRQADTMTLDDPFGFVGGDSILAIRLSALLRQESLLLSISQIQKHPSIREQVLLLQHQDGNGSKSSEALLAASKPVESSSTDQDEVWWEAAEQFSASTGGRIAAEEIQACYPATGTQEMLLLGSMQGPPDCYHVQQLFKLPKSTDLHVLKRVLQDLIQRHDILRTVFTFGYDSSEGSEEVEVARLFQVVLRYASLQWQERGLPGRLEQYRPAEIYNLNGTPWKRWKRDSPMSSYRLIRFEQGDCDALLWTIHHALDDAWSVNLQLEELKHLYHRHVSRHRERSSAESVESTSFGAVFKQMIDLRDQALGGFWTQELNNIQTCRLAAELCYPRSQDRRPCSKSEMEMEFEIPAALSSWLQTKGLSLSTAVIGAYSIMISQLSKPAATAGDGQELEVVFGQILSGRSLALEGLQQVVGPCISIVPRRVKLQSLLSTGGALEEDGLVEWLQSIQSKQAEISDNECVGYLDLARSKLVPSDHMQLFDTMLNFRNFAHRSDNESTSSQAGLLESLDGSDPFDAAMALNISALPGRLEACLNYEDTWISPALAQHALSRFFRVLSQFGERPSESSNGYALRIRETSVCPGESGRGRSEYCNSPSASGDSTPSISSRSRSSFSLSSSSSVVKLDLVTSAPEQRNSWSSEPEHRNSWSSITTLSSVASSVASLNKARTRSSTPDRDASQPSAGSNMRVLADAQSLLEFGAACVSKRNLDVQPYQLFEPNRFDGLQHLIDVVGSDLIALSSATVPA